MSKEYALEIEDLTVAYRQTPVLWDVDVKIPKGVLATIVGPNGAGKSTLIKSALGLINTLSGKVSFFGEPYKNMRNKISYVPQKESVNWEFPTTVLDAVVMGRYGDLGWFKRVRKSDVDLAKAALKELGMAEYMHRHISELSGGQQQRVFLARALVQDAEIYFLDEPFVGIDKQTEKIIIDTLRKLQQEGKTIIVVHHDLNTVMEYFDFILMMDKAMIAYGPTKTTYIPENITKTFGTNLKF